MKFVSNKIYLQDSPKTFGDFCKEASSKNEEMTKVAQSGMVPEVPMEEPEVESTDSGDQEIPEELVQALNELKKVEEADALASGSDTLKVASIEGNYDGTVTVNFKSASLEDLLAELEGDESDEECEPCEGEEMIEESCAYASDYGKFVKVANLTDNQKGYFKDYWTSVWPEEFINALLIDQ